MNTTTLVMAYYENAFMLQTQYNRLASLPLALQQQINVTIVDDGSPANPALPKKDLPLALQVWRIDVDIRWNQDAARNIGAFHAETNWLLLTDMDHMVPEVTWRQLINRSYDPGKAYRFSRVSAPDLHPYKLHPNSWFMSKKLYQEIGGYDERFAGFYGTDGDFRDNVAAKAEIVQLKEPLIRVPRQVIPDASTTAYLRKQPEDNRGIAKVKHARMQEEGWRPLVLSFPYHRVWPEQPLRFPGKGFTGLVLALAAMLALAPLPSRADDPHAHGQDGIPDWYDSNCCNLQDCRPVEDASILFGEIVETGERVVIWKTQAFGKEVLLPYDKSKWRTSKDGRYHTCSNSNMSPLCIYLPASA